MEDPRLTNLHQQIDQSHAEANQRKCPNCDAVCSLHHGRHSGKYFFKHNVETDCIFDRVGASLFFNSRDEAMKAEMIFE